MGLRFSMLILGRIIVMLKPKHRGQTSRQSQTGASYIRKGLHNLKCSSSNASSICTLLLYSRTSICTYCCHSPSFLSISSSLDASFAHLVIFNSLITRSGQGSPSRLVDSPCPIFRVRPVFQNSTRSGRIKETKGLPAPVYGPLAHR